MPSHTGTGLLVYILGMVTGIELSWLQHRDTGPFYDLHTESVLLHHGWCLVSFAFTHQP